MWFPFQFLQPYSGDGIDTINPALGRLFGILRDRQTHANLISLGIQSPPDNGNGTDILCISEVIEHPNHHLRICLHAYRVFKAHGFSSAPKKISQAVQLTARWVTGTLKEFKWHGANGRKRGLRSCGFSIKSPTMIGSDLELPPGVDQHILGEGIPICSLGFPNKTLRFPKKPYSSLQNPFFLWFFSKRELP